MDGEGLWMLKQSSLFVSLRFFKAYRGLGNFVVLYARRSRKPFTLTAFFCSPP